MDLASLASADAKSGVTLYAYTPILSPTSQKATLVLDTPAEVAVWLNGKPVALSTGEAKGEPRTAFVDLPQGPGSLLIRMTPEGPAPLVTTFVADQPVGFAK